LTGSPAQVIVEPWQRPRGVATGTHRKSGVINRLTSARPVELSRLRRSAYLLLTPLQGELQAPSTIFSGLSGPILRRWPPYNESAMGTAGQLG
jgi:hypothetical protein